jgi:hypothetical protein
LRLQKGAGRRCLLAPFLFPPVSQSVLNERVVAQRHHTHHIG